MIAIMSDSLFERFLKLADREQRLAVGSALFRFGDPVLSLFLVTAGELRLVRALPHGSQLTLQRAGCASILAEASLFADRYLATCWPLRNRRYVPCRWRKPGRPLKAIRRWLLF